MQERLVQDLRWAVRYVAHRPVFALTVSLTLAASITAATTAFGLASAVLWRRLPFDDASRLVFVWEQVERDGESHPSRVTGARHAAWRDSASGLSSIALFGVAGFTLETADGATAVHGVRTSANYFDTLAIRPVLGRTFGPADEMPGNHRVVVLSHAFWQERFGGHAGAIGETLRLSGQPYTVVGVMPAVTFPAWPVNPAIVTLDAESRHFWVPIPRTPALDQSDRAHVFGVVARLAPGVTEREVTQRLNATADAAADRHRAHLSPLREQFVADARTPLLALMGAALALLLIACANLAALHSSALESRRTELAVRAAVGAGVVRLIRQLAAETLLLATAGAAVGLLLTRAALAVIPGLLPPSIPFLTVPALDLSVALFATVLAVAATVILSAWPIAGVLREAPTPRGAAAPPRRTVHRVLLVSQISITVALVAMAGLLGQSLQTVRRQDPGFAIDHVFVAHLGLPSPTPPAPGRIASLEQQLMEAIAVRPNVRAVATAYDHPLAANWSEAPTIVGDTMASDRRAAAELRIVSPGYLEALDVELLEGRSLNERDRFDAPGAAMVNEAFAAAIGGGALGRRIRTETPRFLYGAPAANEFQIVGVVKNERFRGLEQPASPAFYLSTRQFPQTALTLLVRTARDPALLVADVRAAVRETDAAITLNGVTSLAAIASDQLAARRVTTSVIGAFATAALVLAALGMYALLAVLVNSRTREIGIRLAIGASPTSVGAQVIGDSLRSVVTGIALGSVMALLTGNLLKSLLVDVSSSDPLTLAGVAAVLIAVAAAAALVPAWRAARTDPVTALRM
jgi:putative ABC transport system permease protein